MHTEFSHFSRVLPKNGWMSGGTQWCRPEWPDKLQSFLVCCDVDVLCTCLRFQIPMHSKSQVARRRLVAHWNWNQIAKLSKNLNHLRASAVKSFQFNLGSGHVKCFIVLNAIDVKSTQTTGCNYIEVYFFFDFSDDNEDAHVNYSGKCDNSVVIEHITHQHFCIDQTSCVAPANTEAKHCGFLGMHQNIMSSNSVGRQHVFPFFQIKQKLKL